MFPSYCRLLVKFSLLTGHTLAQREPLNSRPWNLSQETRKIALSYGIDIFTDRYFVLSQCTCLTDKETERLMQEIASNIVRCVVIKLSAISKNIYPVRSSYVGDCVGLHYIWSHFWIVKLSAWRYRCIGINEDNDILCNWLNGKWNKRL